ncbi:MAG: cupin domain-containing protein [Actinobacteria bacterium]|nr:cupin domain-containing protein [Actinomycetota bacterium]
MYVIHESQVKKVELPGRTLYPMVGPYGIKSERMTFGVAYLPPNSKMDPHKHINEEEIIYIIEGFGKVHFEDGNIEDIEPGSTIVAPKGMDHIMENSSKNTMKWCFCFNPIVRIGPHAK